MDDPEGGGTPPWAAPGEGTASGVSHGWSNAPSGSRSYQSSPGKSNLSVKPKSSYNRPQATFKQYEEYSNLFKPETFYDKFFTITAANKSNLAEIDTIQANEDLEKQIVGTATAIRELRSGRILVAVRTKEQSMAIKNLKKLAECEVEVTSNDRMNRCKGTIYYRNGPRHSEEKIMAALNKTSNIPIQDIYRMKKKMNGDLIEMPIYLLTFQSTQLPTHVNIWLD